MNNLFRRVEYFFNAHVGLVILALLLSAILYFLYQSYTGKDFVIGVIGGTLIIISIFAFKSLLLWRLP